MDILVLLDTDSELILIPGDLKYQCDLPTQVEAYECQVTDGVLPEVHLILGSEGP